MGWVAYLLYGNVVPIVEVHEEGPRECQMHDTARIGITRDYRDQFRAAFDGLGFLEALDGKEAQEVIPLLKRGVDQLGDRPDKLYYASTPGNAGHVLALLLSWARLHPTAVFTIVDYG